MPNDAPSRPEGPSLARVNYNITPFNLEYELPHDGLGVHDSHVSRFPLLICIRPRAIPQYTLT